MNDGLKQTLVSRVYDVAVVSPLQRASKISATTGNSIYLKREDLQPVHSFKIRGAYNKMIQLSELERKQGVLAASAGNHAQGVAMSAQTLGIEATIVMPKTTPGIKIEAVASYGATIVLEGDNYSEAYEASQTILQSSKAVFIHPFNDPAVIAGQGTVGKEICEQLSGVDYIFVPVGGGGLLAGIAQYVKQLHPSIKIIGVEPEDSNAMQQSLKAGNPVTLPHVGVFADGVAVKYVGDLTYAICEAYVDDVITVNNDQICAAIKSIFEETRSIVEPAGALSLAGAVQYTETGSLTGQNIVTICSGANMPFEKLQFVAERTLLGSNKEALCLVELAEHPGALSTLCHEVIGAYNISEFSYRLSGRTTAHILVGISTSDSNDRSKFMAHLDKQGYSYTDISADDVVKEHIRHMVGGSANTQNEQLYTINFPERPGALGEFLSALGTETNISLFHYRGQGGDTGKVMVGFETADVETLESGLAASGYEYSRVRSKAAQTLLSNDH